MDKPSFDLEQIYDSEIAPLMSKVIAVCKQHKLPMFATFLYANDVEAEDSKHCTTLLLFEERPIPGEMMNFQNFGSGAPPLRLRVRNKEGIVTEETVIYP